MKKNVLLEMKLDSAPRRLLSGENVQQVEWIVLLNIMAENRKVEILWGFVGCSYKSTCEPLEEFLS